MEISGKSFHLRLDASEVLSLLWVKLYTIVIRLVDFIRLLPIRLFRWLQHVPQGMSILIGLLRQRTATANLSKSIGLWWLEWCIYSMEILGIGELYETLMDWVKFNTRPLYRWEVRLAREIFGNSINYRRIRVDSYSLLGPRQKHFCYVSFYMINSWGPMENSTFLHELTHIWQYEKFGAVYMPRAIKAQLSHKGYNYGGVATLRKYLKKGKDFLSFNLEQQGDIVSDYYRIRDGYQPRWGNASRQDLAVYERFIHQLKTSWRNWQVGNKLVKE